MVDSKRIDIDLAGQYRAGVTPAEMDLYLALLIWGPEPRKVVGQLARIEMAQFHTLYTLKMGISRRVLSKKLCTLSLIQSITYG